MKRIILTVFLLALCQAGRCSDEQGIWAAHRRHLQERADFTCPTPDGFYPTPGECSGDFFACIDGVPQPLMCPEGMVFDPAVDTCVDYEVSSCRSDFVCPEPEGFFPADPSQCAPNFYVCVNSVPTELLCPEGSVFDPIQKDCTTDCSITTTTPATTITATTPFVCPESEGSFSAIPGECSNTYYICVAGVPTLETCPAAGVFDPLLERCTLNCTVPPTTTTPEVFTCPTDEGLYPSVPEDQCANMYYICLGGIAFEENCPGTSVFDPATKECVPKCPVQLRWNDRFSVGASSVAADFNCPRIGGFHPFLPRQCNNTYYVCVENQPFKRYCPASGVFDPAKMRCAAKCSSSDGSLWSLLRFLSNQ